MSDSVYHTSESAQSLGYYAYVVVPPIQLVLNAIAAHCGVGGTIRPGVRRLAAWADYASAGRISPMLDQLAADGWILYDPSTGLITLLEDPNAPITPRDRQAADDEESQVITEGDQAQSAPITPRDRQAADDEESQVITEGDQAQSAPITPRDRWADSEAITPRDRAAPLPDALSPAITRRDRSTPRMEDHVLVAATETQDSAAARYKIPCSAETITERDHPAALLLAELGADPAIIADALAARPDLTPEQIRASWAHFEPRIRAELCTAGAFFAAIRRGQLHAAPPDPQRPLEPESYADRDGFALGSLSPPGDDLRMRAERITPATISGADFLFVMQRLAMGESDAQALAALEARRARSRGGP